MALDVSASFADSMCMNVRSFRKDGTPVDTPTWVVAEAGRLACYTDDRTYKLKRMRRNPNVEIAACDVVGRCSTPWYRARCRIVEDPQQRDRIFGQLREKYGIHWYLSLWGSLLVDRVRHRVVLEFEPLELVQLPAAAASQ